MIDKNYYKSPSWKEVCRVVSERDGGRCVMCNRPGRQFHHRCYDFFGTGLMAEVDDVHTVCMRCHKLFSDNVTLAKREWTLADMVEQTDGTFIKKNG